MVFWDCRGDTGQGKEGGSIWVKISRVNILTLKYIFYSRSCNFGIYRFERKFNKNYGEGCSPNNFMQSLSVFYCFLMTKKNIAFKFLFTFKPWLLNSFHLCYGSELRKRYTLRLFLTCLEERSFGNCSACGDGAFGERCAWEGLGVGGNFTN